MSLGSVVTDSVVGVINMNQVDYLLCHPLQPKMCLQEKLKVDRLSALYTIGKMTNRKVSVFLVLNERVRTFLFTVFVIQWKNAVLTQSRITGLKHKNTFNH